jgi:hypothetical protein
MAQHLFIVHGWSDIGFSFKPIVDYLTTSQDSDGNVLYEKQNIQFINYKSLDDQTIFEDLADKLDEIFEQYKKEKNITRIDILCHSTGSLVVRSWLALRRVKQKRMGKKLDVPVEHFFLFAPANFGSDLAKLGRSLLNRLRFTFQIRTAEGVDTDPLEVGEKILEGLEPASMVQWRLSNTDLHKETYFGTNDPSGDTCYPFVFSAGRFNESFFRRFVKQSIKLGTDSTIRICGTSLNTRKYTLWLLSNHQTKVSIHRESKFENMAFAVFPQYDHGEIIRDAFKGNWQPGELLKEAKNVTNSDQYKTVVNKFSQINQQNYQQERKKNSVFSHEFQQFFFKVYDDTLIPVTDYDIDFFVRDISLPITEENPDQVDKIISRKLYEILNKHGWYVHTVDRSGRVLMIDYTEVAQFINEDLKDDHNKQLILKVRANSPHRGVKFEAEEFIVFGHNIQELDTNKVKFLFPNTTTLVEIIIDRKIQNEVLNMATTH